MTPEQQLAVSRIAAAAVQAERSTGCPAEVTAAQCVIESGYLQHAPGNNCFGIKAYLGCAGTQLLDTTEWFTDPEAAHFLAHNDGRSAVLVQPVQFDATGRKKYACRDLFATFPTLADCFACHGAMLQRGVYSAVWQRYERDHDMAAFIAGMAKHYATDPEYAELVSKIAHGPHVAAAVVTQRNA